MKSILVLFYPLLATVVASEHALEQPAEDAILGSETVHGCYASLGDLQLNGTYAFNSLGSCASTCNSLRAYVAAVQGESCYCGSSYPAANTLVDDSQCTEPCPGYAANACGGTGVFTVINTGLKTSVTDSDGDSTGSDDATTSTVISTSSATIVSLQTSIAATTTGSGSNSTSSAASSTGTSASASPSSSVVTTSGAASRFSLAGLKIAVAVMGAAILI